MCFHNALINGEPHGVAQHKKESEQCKKKKKKKKKKNKKKKKHDCVEETVIRFGFLIVQKQLIIPSDMPSFVLESVKCVTTFEMGHFRYSVSTFECMSTNLNACLTIFSSQRNDRTI